MTRTEAEIILLNFFKLIIVDDDAITHKPQNVTEAEMLLGEEYCVMIFNSAKKDFILERVLKSNED